MRGRNLKHIFLQTFLVMLFCGIAQANVAQKIQAPFNNKAVKSDGEFDTGYVIMHQRYMKVIV